LGVQSLFKLAGALGLLIVLEVIRRPQNRCLSGAGSGTQIKLGRETSRKCAGKRTLERALRHLAALPWNQVLAAVAEVRARVAEEEAERATKEATAASKTKPAPTQPRPASAFPARCPSIGP
jgi:hypothetical protein